MISMKSKFNWNSNFFAHLFSVNIFVLLEALCDTEAISLHANGITEIISSSKIFEHIKYYYRRAIEKSLFCIVYCTLHNDIIQRIQNKNAERSNRINEWKKSEKFPIYLFSNGYRWDKILKLFAFNGTYTFSWRYPLNNNKKSIIFCKMR